MKQDILVNNVSSPEMNYLALAVAKAGRLIKYVCPYANFHRPKENRIASIPGLFKLYGKTFGRRTLPDGLKPFHVQQVAVLEDLLCAGCNRLGGRRAQVIDQALNWRISKKIDAATGHLADLAQIAFCNYCIANETFGRTPGYKILNYPIAYHRFIQRFVSEEAALQPYFASTLPNWSQVPAWVQDQLDEECDRADMILVGSTFCRDTFTSVGISDHRIRVIPYGADIENFKPLPRKERNSEGLRVLFVGQIGQRKGISYLLQAAKRLCGSGFSFTLVGNIIGNNSAIVPFTEYFEHIPHLPRKDLPAVYNNHDVFLFPTLIEGMPLVVLEAMACGLPVITTPNGPGDIIRDGQDGFIVPIRDVDAICNRLEFLRANPDLRVEMGKHARERAKEFSWEAYMNKIISFIHEIDYNI